MAHRDYLNIFKDFTDREEEYKETLIGVRDNIYAVRIHRDIPSENMIYCKNLIGKKIRHRLDHAPNQKGPHINLMAVHSFD